MPFTNLLSLMELLFSTDNVHVIDMSLHTDSLSLSSVHSSFSSNLNAFSSLKPFLIQSLVFCPFVVVQ